VRTSLLKSSEALKLYFLSSLLLNRYLLTAAYEAGRQVQNIYIGSIVGHRNGQPIYKQETELVSIGLTLTSLFISGEDGLQPMDICDEEKTWRPLCFVLLRLRKDT
jgi:hypothetical protein